MDNPSLLELHLLSMLGQLAETREKQHLWPQAVSALMALTNARMGQLESWHPHRIHATVGISEPDSGAVRHFELKAAGSRSGRLTLHFAAGKHVDPEAESLLRLSCVVFALALDAQAKSQEMEAFIHGAAHDLRGAAGRASTFAQLLADLPDLTSENREIATHLAASASSLDPLIRDIVAYVSIDNLPDPNTVSLGAVFDAVRWNTSKSIRSREASLSFDGHSLSVLAHEANLGDVLQRLIDNSLKFGPPKPEISISAESAVGHVLLSVKDNGPGIEAAYREQVFKPFERLHGKQIPGHGLGLAICRKYVHSLGGQIGLEHGEGLTVLIKI